MRTQILVALLLFVSMDGVADSFRPFMDWEVKIKPDSCLLIGRLQSEEFAQPGNLSIYFRQYRKEATAEMADPHGTNLEELVLLFNTYNWGEHNNSRSATFYLPHSAVVLKPESREYEEDEIRALQARGSQAESVLEALGTGHVRVRYQLNIGIDFERDLDLLDIDVYLRAFQSCVDTPANEGDFQRREDYWKNRYGNASSDA